MDKKRLEALLSSVAKGGTPVEEALDQLKDLPFENMDMAHIDHHRSVRKGFPEVIFGEGKTGEDIAVILDRIIAHESVAMVTRIDSKKAALVTERIPESTYHSDARILIVEKTPLPIEGKGTILVISAGTSDIPVAKEALITAQTMGNKVDYIFDVGVAGIHRLFAYKEKIDDASVLIVVAGMEGALPSVVAGLVRRPVIAVPTSVGYGTSFGGLTALLAMLNACSSNVAVVNIDNGFGAGYMASMINRV